MKRARGRPSGKVFPQSNDHSTALYIAGLGSLGASDGMRFADVCFSTALHLLKTKSPSRNDRKRRRWTTPRPSRQLSNEIGTVVWQRLLAGDHAFFDQVAKILNGFEQLSTKKPALERRRSLALDYKWQCEFMGQPFTERGLADWYKRKGHSIDSSNLSKTYRWAESAKTHTTPESLARLIREPRNPNGLRNWYNFHVPEMDPDFREVFLIIRKQLARPNCLKRLTRSQL
jgi:hypothetical protein